MKKFAILFVIIFAANIAFGQAMPVHPRQCADPALDKTLHQIVEGFRSAFNSGDPAKIAALYAEDATYMTQHFVTGIVHGRPAITAYMKKGTDANYKIDSLKILASDCSGDFAYTINRYESTNGGQKAFGLNLVVLKKFKEKWLIVAHETAVPDTAMAIQSLDIPSGK
jgi:ketosteroid isomerase-like protein